MTYSRPVRIILGLIIFALLFWYEYTWYHNSVMSYSLNTPAAAQSAAQEEEAAAEPEPAYEAEEPQMNEAVTQAEGASKSADEAAAPSEQESPGALGLWEVTCLNDTLFVSMHGTLPEPVEEIKYTITGTDDGGLETVYAEGTLGDILIERDPLMLDIAEYDLSAGTYTLTIDGESIEFEVE